MNGKKRKMNTSTSVIQDLMSMKCDLRLRQEALARSFYVLIKYIDIFREVVQNKLF